MRPTDESWRARLVSRRGNETGGAWPGRSDEIGARSARSASGSRRTLSGRQERLRAEACICLESDREWQQAHTP
jgi:hypothetical protein